jgi:hypothetical protein
MENLKWEANNDENICQDWNHFSCFLNTKIFLFYLNVQMINWFYYIYFTYDLKNSNNKRIKSCQLYIYNMYKVRPKDKGITRIRAHWGGGWVILLMHVN